MITIIGPKAMKEECLSAGRGRKYPNAPELMKWCGHFFPLTDYRAGKARYAEVVVFGLSI